MALWQYLDIIYKGYSGSGLVWLQYDKVFRMRTALNPFIKWNQIYPQLWIQVMMPARPIVRECSDSGQLVYHPSSSLGSYSPAACSVLVPLLVQFLKGCATERPANTGINALLAVGLMPSQAAQDLKLGQMPSNLAGIEQACLG